MSLYRSSYPRSLRPPHHRLLPLNGYLIYRFYWLRTCVLWVSCTIICLLLHQVPVSIYLGRWRVSALHLVWIRRLDMISWIPVWSNSVCFPYLLRNSSCVRFHQWLFRVGCLFKYHCTCPLIKPATMMFSTGWNEKSNMWSLNSIGLGSISLLECKKKRYYITMSSGFSKQ